MSKPAVSVENLSKAYRIGLKDEIPDSLMGAAIGLVKAPFRNFARLRRLNTFHLARAADSNGNGKAVAASKPEEDDIVWALRDVSFDVHEGEVVGIIGRNGAGKSTLLKILSRITEPTSGRAVIRGRVSSLLEVGTGFHPELTGRENVYMNGTILGMRKREIDRKFDAIVDFSGVEKFLDTPIKRYSSGMKVRLAFSVAAHLEPEILIIDEVLAVGDQEFQNKCLGKMQDVATAGRTVLFVSHNMAAIQNLCTSGLVLQHGSVLVRAKVDDVVEKYMGQFLGTSSSRDFTNGEIQRAGSGDVVLSSAAVLTVDGRPTSAIKMGDGFRIRLKLSGRVSVQHIAIAIGLFNGQGVRLCGLNSRHTNGWTISIRSGESRIVDCDVPSANLAPGHYLLNLQLKSAFGSDIYDRLDSALSFEVTPADVFGTGAVAAGSNLIFLRPLWTSLSNWAEVPEVQGY